MNNETSPGVTSVRPETRVQSSPTGANLTPSGQLIEAVGRFRQIGLEHRDGKITTDERDETVGEVMAGLPAKVQDYFRQGREMTKLREILEGKEIDLKPKSKKKDPGGLERSKHKGKHKWKQKHRDTSYIKSLMTKSR